MSVGDKTQQRTYTFICTKLGKSPMETKQLLGKRQCFQSI